MGIVLRIPEAGDTVVQPQIYAVHKAEQGIGVIGETLLRQNKKGEVVQIDQCIMPAVSFCSTVVNCLEQSYARNIMDTSFLIAHKDQQYQNESGIPRAVVGAAALATKSSLRWGAIGDCGVALIHAGDGAITFLTDDDCEPFAPRHETHRQRWENPAQFASINGDDAMIGREQTGSADITLVGHKIVVFSGQCREILKDDQARDLLLQAAASESPSGDSLRSYIATERQKHRFPEGAMRMIVMEAGSRQNRAQYDQGARSARGITGPNTPFAQQMWMGGGA